MNLSRCKRRTLTDVFFFYPYKKNIPYKENTIPVPYVKKQDCSDHRLSVDWYEWYMIVNLYISKLKNYLEDGNSIELASGGGAFHLVKFKCTRFVDFKKSAIAGKQITFVKNNVDNYFIATSWARRKVHIKLKCYWKVTLNSSWLRSMYLACEKDYTKIYKIHDSK